MYQFKKSQRLLNRKQFDLVFKQSNKIISSDFVIYYHANQENHARLGLAISKKNVRKAHDRNRIKRIVRESFRLSNLGPVDIVCVARRHTDKTPHSTLTKLLANAWRKLDVY